MKFKRILVITDFILNDHGALLQTIVLFAIDCKISLQSIAKKDIFDDAFETSNHKIQQISCFRPMLIQYTKGLKI